MHPHPPSLMVRAALACGGTLLGLLAIEAGARLCAERLGLDDKLHAKLKLEAQGLPQTPYDGTPYTIYRLRRGAGVNSLGFADREWSREHAPDTLRVACLGASTTQDGIGANRGAYPEHLAVILGERLGRPVETLNFGIDGWTSGETMINYFLNVIDYAPDVIVVQHALNDVWPRLWPGFVNDYRHYRHPWLDIEFGPVAGVLFRHSTAFALLHFRAGDMTDFERRNTQPLGDRLRTLAEARLVPETTVAFRENLRAVLDHASAKGTLCVLMTIKTNPASTWLKNRTVMEHLTAGTQEHNRIVRELAAETGAQLVDVAAAWEPDFDRRVLPHYVDGFVHCDSLANRWKAELVAESIAAALSRNPR